MDRSSFAVLGGQRKYHLIVDDGLHSIGANLNTTLWVMDHVEDGGYIVIEDIGRLNYWSTVDFILSTAANKMWETHALRCQAGNIFMIQKLGKGSHTL